MAANANQNSSSAYDFSRFEDRSERRTIKVIKNKNPKNCLLFGLTPMAVLFVAAIVVAITSLFIYNNVMLTEIGAQINVATSSLAELENEQVRLQTALETKMSVKNVEDIAQNSLGLVKMDRSQIEYIKLAPEDVVEMAQSTTASKNIVDDIITKIKEYLSE